MRNCRLYLLTALLLLAVVGCNDSDTATDTDQNTQEPSVTTEAEAFADNLPEKDFGGKTFTIWGNAHLWSYFIDAEEDGDVINDAVYRRNSKIAERFNVTLAFDLKYDDWKYPVNDETRNFQAGIMAGDGAFDLYTGVAAHAPQTVFAGCLQELSDLQYLDLEQVWWMSDINAALNVGSKQFLVSGYYEIPTLLRTDIVFFSSKLAESHEMGDLYELVEAGDWTFDTMISMAREVGSDLNGDGKQTEEDQFGLVSLYDHIGALYTGTGYDNYSRDKDGYLVLTEPDDALFEANTMLYELTHECTEFYLCGNEPGVSTDDTAIVNAFTDDRSLFFLGFISYCSDTRFRNMGDYGILPIPKFDEEQKDYGTWSSPFVSGIPTDAKDPEMSSIILEALECESYQSVRPAYYSTSLSNKYLNDPDAVKMLDLIFGNVKVDTGYLFGIEESDFYLGVKEEYASLLERRKKKRQSYVDSINESFMGIE